MLRKNILVFILSLVMVVTFLPNIIGMGQEKIIIKAAHVAPTTNPYHLGLEYFAKLVKERTNGQVEVEIFPATQLGNERDMVEAMQMGALEMAVIANAVFGSICSEAMLFEMPFLFRDNEHCFKVVDGPIGNEIRNLFPKFGLRILGYIDGGFRHPFTKNTPIINPGDLKGLKMRVMENPIHMAIYEVFGAKPVAMGSGEQYTALQQGVIDGSDNSLVFYSSIGLWEFAKHITINIPFLKNVATYTISESFFKAQTKELQKILIDSGYEAALYERKVFAEQEERLLSELKDAGVKVHYTDNLSAFQEKAKLVWKQFEEKVSIDKINAVLETE